MIGGILGLGLGIYGGNKAASAQRHAAADADARIRAGEARAQDYLQPYAETGKQALTPLTALLTGKLYNFETNSFSDLSPDQRMSYFLQSPGYQFRLNQGLSAINKQQLAQGRSLSGGALKEITDYSQGMASDEYNNYLSQLFQMAGFGQNTAQAQANTAMGAATQSGQYSYLGGMGNAAKYSNLSNAGYKMMGNSMSGDTQGLSSLFASKGAAGGAAGGAAVAA